MKREQIKVYDQVTKFVKKNVRTGTSFSVNLFKTYNCSFLELSIYIWDKNDSILSHHSVTVHSDDYIEKLREAQEFINNTQVQ